jgi:hypothetical protein
MNRHRTFFIFISVPQDIKSYIVRRSSEVVSVFYAANDQLEPFPTVLLVLVITGIAINGPQLVLKKMVLFAGK